MLVFTAVYPNHKTQVADTAHDVGEVDAVVYADTEVNDAVVGVALVYVDMLDAGALLGNTRGEGGDNTALTFHLNTHIYQELAANRSRPVHLTDFIWIIADFRDIAAGILVDDQPFAGADVTDDRVAGNRAATAREADHHAFGGINRNRRVSRAGARLEFGIRLQLLGLFGLLLLTGAAVLALDEYERQQNQAALLALKDESLAGLRRIKAVSDAYGMDIVDTTFRVRNHLISWEEGLQVVDHARLRIRDHWQALEAMPLTEEQAQIFAQVQRSKVRADTAAETLRQTLVQKDIVGLGRFADTELYPAIDPVTTRMKHLGDLEMIEAEQKVRAQAKRAQRTAWLRTGLSFITLLVVAAVGRKLLRNIYKGVESLTSLAQQMRRHDYQGVPRYSPSGELGDVMDAFLAMRDDVRKYDAELNEQLARNEQVRTALIERDMFQRSLFTAARAAIMSMDTQGVFTTFNPQAERLTGHRAEQMVGRAGLDRLVSPADLDRLASGLAATRDHAVPADARLFPLLIDQRPDPLELDFVRKDGESVPMLLATSPVRDAAGNTVGYLAVGTDLTQIKQLEQRLRASETRALEASEAKSNFVAAMSHEIRTPMIGVTGMLEVLSHSQLDDDQRRTIAVIQQSARSLLQIIGDILDFSKVEAGRLELSPTTISLPRLLQSTVANFSGSASSKGLVLLCEVDDRIGPAHRADGLRLRQVLSNFLSNAIKFTESGFVEAALEWKGREGDGDRIGFRITDTGIGVTAEQQAKLFQPFQQAEGSITRRFGGTGLGLVISRRLAELMGGEVRMESTPGAGTTMRLCVVLPRGEEAGRVGMTDEALERIPIR